MVAKEIFKNESAITPEKERSEQRNLITPSQLKMEIHKTGKQKCDFFIPALAATSPHNHFYFLCKP